MGVVSIVILGILAYAFYTGYKKGFIHKLASVIGLLLAYQLAGPVSGILKDYLEQSHHVSTLTSKYFAYGLAFVLILILIRVIAILVVKLLKLLGINFVNKGLGGTINIVIYASIISILIYFLADLNLLSAEKSDEQLVSYGKDAGKYLMHKFFNK